jgi:1-acyl-sn-glycerol-3-phosphate acyltransferase
MSEAAPRGPPSRLGASKRTPLLADGVATDWPPPFGAQWVWLGYLLIARRAVALLLITLIGIPIQSALLLLPGHWWMRFARLYWRLFRWCFGVHLRVIGEPARGLPDGSRAVIFISNHSSWLDIPVLGSVLYARFVSKDEIANWPLISTVAKLGRTVFISRSRARTREERDLMQQRLRAGDNLILFPEGTTSDGARVLPFRTAFLSIALGEDPPLVQPVSLVYNRLAGLPVGRAAREIFAYHGDTSIGEHFWRLSQWRGLGATMLLHPPLDPRDFSDRKALAQAARAAVADGAAALRQSRLTVQAPAPAATQERRYA